MKIGTLTFHKAINYGAVLQAYALQNYIMKLGYDTEIIDFTPNKAVNKQFYYIKKILNLLKNPNQILKRKLDKNKTEKFDLFRLKNLNISENSYTGDKNIEENPPYYDYYIAGSDQIWNSDLSNSSKAFYLHFPISGKKISYATSFGKDYLNENEEVYIKDYLPQFSSISVREQHHANMLANKFNIKVEVTLDPVFLLDKNEWSKLQLPVDSLPEKYVLVYILENSKELYESARKKAQELNCEIIYISQIADNIEGKVLRDIGPSEYLYTFINALYICTNSFHGTAFSIIFNKDFSVVRHTNRNSRIDNILEIADLRNRYYEANNLMNSTNINYEIVNSNVNKYIKTSKEFIENSLAND